jgi:PAS domain S-box-containing protein
MSGNRTPGRPPARARRGTDANLSGPAGSTDFETLTREEIRHLVHELEVHEEELEVQNDELARARRASEEVNEGYRRLYESTPIGQLTIKGGGEIVATNRRAAAMLGIPESAVGANLSSFVSEGHQDRWYLARRALEAGEPLAFELSLVRGDGSTLEGQFTGWHPANSNATFELALLDVTTLRSMERALRRAASEASLAEQRERRKLASDLHDDAGQLLSLASLKIAEILGETAAQQADDPLREVASLVADARRRISSLSFELSPPLLHDVGLVAAIHWLADHMVPQYGLEVSVDETTEPDLDEATRVTLYRSTRELLINVAKHAQVRRARVQIGSDGGVVRVAVEDHGVGLPLESSRAGFGLLALRERIAHLGGSVSTGSGAQGVGTRIVVSLPIASSP